MPLIRPASLADFEALGRIAHATGYFGASAERYFPSAVLFQDLWIKPYLDGVGGCGFVGLLGDAPIGYVLGTPDIKVYRRYFLSRLPKLLGRAVRGDYPGLGGSVGYLLRSLLYPARLAPIERYPAQLHLNLLAEARGKGLGERLLTQHLECLRTHGIVGVQLSTTRDNTAAIRLYSKLGFGVYAEWQSPLWKPWLGREVVHVVMVLSLDGGSI